MNSQKRDLKLWVISNLAVRKSCAMGTGNHEKIGKEILVVLGLVVAIVISLFLLQKIFFHFSLMPTDFLAMTWLNVLAMGLSYLTGVLVAAFYASWLFSLGAWQGIQFLGFKVPNWKQLLVGLLASLPMIFIDLIAVHNQPGISLRSNWAPHFVFTLLGAVFFEESIFRGFLFQYFRKNHTFITAALGSSLLWSLMHLNMSSQFGEQWISMVLALLLGFPFAYLFEKGKNVIWGAMIVHLTVDSNQLFVNPDGTFINTGIWGVVGLLIAVIVIFVFPKWILKDLD